jgi:hypothetical protein
VRDDCIGDGRGIASAAGREPLVYPTFIPNGLVVGKVAITNDRIIVTYPPQSPEGLPPQRRKA